MYVGRWYRTYASTNYLTVASTLITPWAHDVCLYLGRKGGGGVVSQPELRAKFAGKFRI